MYTENAPRWHVLATYFFRRGRCLRGVSRLPVAGISRPALRRLPVFYRDVLRVRNLVVFSQRVAPRGEGDVAAAGVAGPQQIMVGVEERCAPRVVLNEPLPAPSDLLCGPRFRDISRAPAPHNMSRLSEMTSMPFRDAKRRSLYRMFLHILHLLAFVSRPDTPWRTVLPPEGGEGPQWGSLYKGVVPLYVGDLGWRVLHRAVACNKLLSRFTDSSAACIFCGEEETVFHIYMECERLLPLYQYLKGLFLKFWLHFSPTILVFGHKAGCGESQVGGWDLPVGLLLGLAKMAIRGSRQQAMDGQARVGCLPLFRAYVRARVSLEREHAVFTGTLEVFRGRWSPRGVESIVNNDCNVVL